MTEKFTVLVEIVGGVKQFHITWPVNPIRRDVFDELCRFIHKTYDFGPMNDRKLSSIQRCVDRINKKYRSTLSTEQAVAIYNIVMKDIVIKGYSRMNKMIDAITAEYVNGRGILELSIKYNFPPLSLLRGILLCLRIQPTVVYEIFSNKVPPMGILSRRDTQQFCIAEKYDAESTFNQQLMADVAARNELVFVNYIKSLGIAFTTQEELVAEQTKKYGRALMTPDILFESVVFINKTRVMWIDYKDYVATTVPFLYRSNAEQAAKYLAEFGPGAMCYHKGVVEQTTLPGAILLDVSVMSLQLQ